MTEEEIEERLTQLGLDLDNLLMEYSDLPRKDVAKTLNEYAKIHRNGELKY